MILGSSARFSNTIYLDLARFSNFSEIIPRWVRSTVCLSGSVGGQGRRPPLPVLRVGGDHMLYRLIPKVFASFLAQMMQIQGT